MMESDKPADQRICFDPIAGKLSGKMVKMIKGLYDFLGKVFGMPWIYDRMEKKGIGVFGFVAARTRYFDDYLKGSVEQGIEQLVILGAGLDSRAYRFQEIL